MTSKKPMTETLAPIWNIFDFDQFDKSTIRQDWRYMTPINPSSVAQIVPNQEVKFEITDQNSYIADCQAELAVKFHITDASGTAIGSGLNIALDNPFIFTGQEYQINGTRVEYGGRFGNLASHVDRLVTYSRDYAETTGSDRMTWLNSNRNADSTELTLNPTGVQAVTTAGGSTPVADVFVPNEAFIIGKNANYNEGFAKKRALSNNGNQYTYRIPVNELFKVLKFYPRVMIGFKRQFIFQMDEYANLLASVASGGGSGVAAGAKIVIDDLRLWYPVYVPSESVQSQLLPLLTAPTAAEFSWEACDVYMSGTVAAATTNISYQFGNMGTKPTKILFGLQLLTDASQTGFTTTFRNLSMTSCNLRIGTENYPYNGKFNCNFSAANHNTTELWTEFIRCTNLRDLKGTGLMLSKQQWEDVYTLIGFNLQDCDQKLFVGSSQPITFEATLSTAAASDYRIIAFVYSEKKSKFSVSDQRIEISYA